jgi:glycosyltransferase involved in cell wall biosynthesis
MRAAPRYAAPRPRLLHVAPFSPVDTDSGGRVRLAATVGALGRDWTLHGLYLEPDIERLARTRAVLGDQTEVLPAHHRTRFRSSRGRLRDIGLRTAHLLVLTLGARASDFFAACSREFAAVVEQRAGDVDVALIEFGQIARCRPPRTPSVIVLHDLNWRKLEAHARAHSSSASAGLLETRRLRAEARALRKMEAELYAGYDAVIVVSTRDREALLEAWRELGLPYPPTFVSPNGVDVHRFTRLRANGRPGTAAFVGSLDHPPNRDAVEFLVSSILPQTGPVLKRLLLAGGGTERIARERVVGLGRVADVGTVYEQACITLAPIRWGSGTRLKILESLASGRPVVAFPEAVEGLEDLVGCGGLFIARDADGFAELIERYVVDPAAARRAGELAQAAVQTYDWALTLNGVRAALDYVLAEPATRAPAV